MNERRPIAKSEKAWLSEIAEAYLDAREAMAFGLMGGSKITENELYHLAPLVCLKFRGVKDTEKNKKRATEAALSSYVANENANSGILKNPIMAFAFCYILSHYGLDLVNENECERILLYVENNLDEMKKNV